MNNLTMNDFFCGCGGMAIGFKNAGYEITGAWDFDKYCIQSYRENIGEHAIQEDIKNMTWEDIPKASVWTFGFPCQDLSVAGKQRGMEIECLDCGDRWQVDPEAISDNSCPSCESKNIKSANRSGLFFEIMRLLDETRENQPGNMPIAIMAENVKGLKPYIELLKKEYKKRGYTAHVQIYNSKYWKVSQNRERYYIVGIKEDVKGEFNFPEEDTSFVPKLSTALDKEVDEKYYISDDKARTIINEAVKRLEKLGKVHATLTPDRTNKRQNGRRAKEEEEEMFTLTAQDLHGVIIENQNLKEDLQGCFTTKDGTAYACTASYQNGLVIDNPMRCRSRTMVVEENEECTEATSYAEANLQMVGMLDMKGNECIRRVYDPEGIAPTLTTCQGGHRQAKIFDYNRYRVRKLTPTEYGRLQAFPMETWKQVVSDSQAYKQFGNAVTTTVVTSIAEAIKKVIQAQETKVIAHEFNPVNRLEDMIARKKTALQGTDEDSIACKADIAALEMALELMTVTKSVANKVFILTQR